MATPTPVDPNMKRCRTCGEMKPRSDFYTRRDAVDGLAGQCKSCENGRKRQDPARIIRNRARQRAVEDLIRAHQSEFKDLQAKHLKQAQTQAAAIAAAEGLDEDAVVLLRSGPAADGEQVTDRVART